MLRKKNNNNEISVALVASFIILLGLFFLSYNYVQAKRLKAYEYMDNIFYKDTKENVKEEVQVETKEVEETEVPNNQSNYQYIGYLEMPKIGFKKGFVDVNSKDNNVEKNLFVASSSNYPDVDKGNLIIAGHSGTGYKAFFKNLYKINMNDQASVYYQDKKYTYNVVKIYEYPKVGAIAVYRDYSKTTLTLVTCTKDNDKMQTVYILELISVN